MVTIGEVLMIVSVLTVILLKNVLRNIVDDLYSYAKPRLRELGNRLYKLSPMSLYRKWKRRKEIEELKEQADELF